VNDKRVLQFSVDFEKDADLEEDAKNTGCTWVQLERLAHSSKGWRKLVDGLCSGEEDRHKKIRKTD
jgi:hypothetical protein